MLLNTQEHCLHSKSVANLLWGMEELGVLPSYLFSRLLTRKESKFVPVKPLKRIFCCISRVKCFEMIKYFLSSNTLLGGGEAKERFSISIPMQGRYLRAIVSLTDN